MPENKTEPQPVQKNKPVYVLQVPDNYVEPPPTKSPEIKIETQVNTTSFVNISSSILDQQRLKEEARI